MAKRLTKITTKTGDGGETGLGDGQRVRKNHPRIEAIGDIDELNSCLGLLAACLDPNDATTLQLLAIQQRLLDIGGELSIPDYAIISAGHVAKLEQETQAINEGLEPLTNFILPGGSLAASHAHLARSICRRAERRLVALAGDAPINPMVLAFINRLSDYLFVVARSLAKAGERGEILWDRDR